MSAFKKDPCVADTEIGIGGTSAWKLSSLTPKTTVAICFEVVNQVIDSHVHRFTSLKIARPADASWRSWYDPAGDPIPARLWSISTSCHDNFQKVSGSTAFGRLFSKSWVDPGSNDIVQSFDQEAAAAIMSRIATFKSEVDDGPDVLRWLDRMLIRLCLKFSEYRKEDVSSFRLSDQFSIYPQFMFHLRRSQFLQVCSFHNLHHHPHLHRLIYVWAL